MPSISTNILIVVVSVFIALIFNFVLLAVKDKVKKFIHEYIDKKKPEPVKNPNVEAFERANLTIPPHLLHYIAGQKNAMALVKIALYKMYLDGELLNCESLILGMQKTLAQFSDQKLVDRLVTEYETYMKKLETPSTGIGTGEQGQPPTPEIPGINGD
jgi:hypothetical protein